MLERSLQAGLSRRISVNRQKPKCDPCEKAHKCAERRKGADPLLEWHIQSHKHERAYDPNDHSTGADLPPPQPTPPTERHKQWNSHDKRDWIRKQAAKDGDQRDHL
jgi:hypothetical protein